jgi:hypothetical protein
MLVNALVTRHTEKFGGTHRVVIPKKARAGHWTPWRVGLVVDFPTVEGAWWSACELAARMGRDRNLSLRFPAVLRPPARQLDFCR